ncbi:TPA: nucleoside-diphosphate kinase [Candidatus Micrarchaeota archaeon]|nr:nucleoside-diphosphate kinase [Candidatus Micrarchaeota archaeon]
MSLEKTFVILKPDAMRKHVLGKVIERLENAGLKPVAMKMALLHDAILEEHYSHLKDKPFFPGLAKFMKDTPVVMGVWEGENAVAKVRELCGPTDSKKAAKGTIRGDFGKDVQENIIHASDSIETTNAEIKRFFKDSELFEWR